MKVFFIVLLIIDGVIILAVGSIWGYYLYLEHQTWLSRPTPEEIEQQSIELFEAVEESLDSFVTYLKENDLLEVLISIGIDFHDNEANARKLDPNFGTRGKGRLTVFNGEMIEKTSAPHIVEFFENETELLSIIREISIQGVINNIYISDTSDDYHEDVRINVYINTIYTSFVQRGWIMYNYMEGKSAPEQRAHYGYRHIRANWYWWQTPPPV